MANAHDIIRRPIITEKSMNNMADGKYSFEVHSKANKSEIKKAVEKIFDVKVTRVNTMNMLGKVKTQGMHSGRRRSWKKAIVFIEGNTDKLDDYFGGMI